MAESELEMVARHVAAGRRIVARQRAMIATLKVAGHSVHAHEQTLRIFESTLQLFDEHEREIRERLGLSAA
jgi:hypothetical protein